MSGFARLVPCPFTGPMLGEMGRGHERSEVLFDGVAVRAGEGEGVGIGNAASLFGGVQDLQ